MDLCGLAKRMMSKWFRYLSWSSFIFPISHIQPYVLNVFDSVLHRSIDCTISIVFQLKSFLADRRFYAFQGIYKSETRRKKKRDNNNNFVCEATQQSIAKWDFKSTTKNDAQIFTHGLNGSVRVHFNREKYVRRWTTATQVYAARATWIYELKFFVSQLAACENFVQYTYMKHWTGELSV